MSAWSFGAKTVYWLSEAASVSYPVAASTLRNDVKLPASTSTSNRVGSPGSGGSIGAIGTVTSGTVVSGATVVGGAVAGGGVVSGVVVSGAVVGDVVVVVVAPLSWPAT